MAENERLTQDGAPVVELRQVYKHYPLRRGLLGRPGRRSRIWQSCAP